MNIFITGTSSGIGHGLALHYLNDGHKVFGVSRRSPSELLKHELYKHQNMDLNNLEAIDSLKSLFAEELKIDLAILNAGVLGRIQDLKDTTTDELKSIMHTNLWSNKALIDFLVSNYKMGTMVAMSSGASVNGSRGWGGYSLSKASLNMLMKLYASENDDTNFYAFAPGLVDTALQDYLCEEVDEEKFTSAQRLKAARNTEHMPNPREAGPILAKAIAQLSRYDSGSFVDIRKM